MANNNGYLCWPVDNGMISQLFNNYNPELYGDYNHSGVDIKARLGTPILSVFEGEVMWVGYDPNGYGNYARIYHHLLGVHSFYAHMQSRPRVTVGSTIPNGYHIGDMGDTGYSKGAHLHIEIRVGDRLAYRDAGTRFPRGRIDFLSWFAAINREHRLSGPGENVSEG